MVLLVSDAMTAISVGKYEIQYIMVCTLVEEITSCYLRIYACMNQKPYLCLIVTPQILVHVNKIYYNM